MEFFRSVLHGFLPFSLVSLTELCSLWYGLKDLFTLHKLLDKVFLDHLKLMMLHVVESTWISMGGHGRLRGEWVNLFPNRQA